MPKPMSRSRSGGTKSAQDRKWNIIGILVVAAIVIGVGYSWWQSSTTKSTFTQLVAGGKPISSQIKTTPPQGQRHLQAGQPFSYPDQFPTSGRHNPNWQQPGFYDSPQTMTKIVHSLEHGNIVIYYDKPGEEALGTLKSWAAIYTGQWDGIVVMPKKGIGQTVVLTAWTKTLTLEKFDPSAAAAFIDLFRGRGPENRTR